MTTIPVGTELFARVDAEDIPALLVHQWRPLRVSGKTYAYRRDAGRAVLMHRVIMGVDGSTYPLIDHINGDGLDNRRSNIRLATRSQNMANSGPRTGRKYKGVYPHRKRWRAMICADYQQHFVGSFDTPEQAASAYDAAARRYFGEFAWTNFPVSQETK